MKKIQTQYHKNKDGKLNSFIYDAKDKENPILEIDYEVGDLTSADLRWCREVF